jgi:hypothetical protein
LRFLQMSILEGAEKVCGRTKGPPRHNESWWWNDDVGKVVDEKRKVYKAWKKSNKEEDKILFCVAERNAKSAV